MGNSTFRTTFQSHLEPDEILTESSTIVAQVQHSAIVLMPFLLFWKSLVSIYTY